MYRISIAMVLVMFIAGSAMASEKTEVMAPVHQFVDGFNKGDMASVVAACADEAFIIDDFPPYAWQGVGACSKWMDAYAAGVKAEGITDAKATPGTPRHVDVSSDIAYVVLPMTLAYKTHGKPVRETGSLWTLALRKGPNGWRIAGWTWSKGKS